jgi:hypothetical protein
MEDRVRLVRVVVYAVIVIIRVATSRTLSFNASVVLITILAVIGMVLIAILAPYILPAVAVDSTSAGSIAVVVVVTPTATKRVVLPATLAP